jgi:AcrR family transcriptional regulator
MTRTADEARRAELLDRIAQYVVTNGLSDLSLRPLAAAVGSSPRVLLYYFGSKEALIVEVLRRVGDGQRSLLQRMSDEPYATPVDACRAMWNALTVAEIVPVMRLFFEVYGLALRDPQRFPGFFDRAIFGWIAFIEEPLLREGVSPAQARSYATLVLSGFRGFMLDLCATEDRARIDAAIELWFRALQLLSPQKELRS